MLKSGQMKMLKLFIHSSLFAHTCLLLGYFDHSIFKNLYAHKTLVSHHILTREGQIPNRKKKPTGHQNSQKCPREISGVQLFVSLDSAKKRELIFKPFKSTFRGYLRWQSVQIVQSDLMDSGNSKNAITAQDIQKYLSKKAQFRLRIC